MAVHRGNGSVAASGGTLLEMIRSTPEGLTRAEILERTGMSRTTLVARLDSLRAAGLTHEGATRSSTGGRPAQYIRFDDRDRVVLGLEMGHHVVRAAVLSASGQVLERAEIPRHDSSRVLRDVEDLADLGRSLLARRASARLVGVGIGVPAPVEMTKGVLWRSVAVPEDSVPILETLADRFGTLVVMENDARALALGAAEDAAAIEEDDVLLALKYSTGIGAGIITGTHIMRGATGSAGDIGHMRVGSEGPVCTCGNRGCLAAYSSGRALLSRLDREDLVDVDDLARSFELGDTEVVAAVRTACTVLGRAVAGLLHAANPRVLCIGGELGRVPGVSDLIQEAIPVNSSERVHGAITVTGSDQETTLRGIAVLVMREAFSVQRIDDQLAALPTD
ncbi:ROK family transcriptional regulator [Brachybacterium sp. Marseille-Q2903]|uniref:ROK family transcriptional regulator n=1 Tax=Brachybacterium epidermidis TaxID=2781983 RepID=A0ABR9VYA3_9MICO|nr:ROK family transcriptional regulator [Brachybacterium epidermidis]